MLRNLWRFIHSSDGDFNVTLACAFTSFDELANSLLVISCLPVVS